MDGAILQNTIFSRIWIGRTRILRGPLTGIFIKSHFIREINVRYRNSYFLAHPVYSTTIPTGIHCTAASSRLMKTEFSLPHNLQAKNYVITRLIYASITVLTGHNTKSEIKKIIVIKGRYTQSILKITWPRIVDGLPAAVSALWRGYTASAMIEPSN